MTNTQRRPNRDCGIHASWCSYLFPAIVCPYHLLKRKPLSSNITIHHKSLQWWAIINPQKLLSTMPQTSSTIKPYQPSAAIIDYYEPLMKLMNNSWPSLWPHIDSKAALPSHCWTQSFSPKSGNTAPSAPWVACNHGWVMLYNGHHQPYWPMVRSWWCSSWWITMLRNRWWLIMLKA